jgi:hypothetical protein
MKSRMKRGPVIFVVVYLTIQILLAGRALSRPHRSSSFGWRMFLNSGRVVRFDVGFRDGRVVELNAIQPKISIPLVGAQVDRPRFVPPYLCSQIPGAAWVRIHVPTVAPTDYPCQ